MPPRIFRRDQPRFQGRNLRHRFGRVARCQRLGGGIRLREIARTAQRINHTHGLFGIQGRAASPQSHCFAAPLPRQVFAIEVIRDPCRM